MIVVCADNEVLIGDTCIFQSESAGDITLKEECSNYLGSFGHFPFSLMDGQMLLSKAAFMKNALVI